MALPLAHLLNGKPTITNYSSVGLSANVTGNNMLDVLIRQVSYYHSIWFGLLGLGGLGA